MDEKRPRVPYGSIAIVLVILAFYYFVLLPNRLGSGRSPRSEIVNNLRQLDGAKQQWAIEHEKTGDVMITKVDVAPYLKIHDGWVPVIAGERYTLNSLTASPQAELTHKIPGLPKGTILRVGTIGEEIIILPTNAAIPRPRS